MHSVDPDMPELEKGLYLHAKTGNTYEVLGVAMHSESHEALVIYRPLYESKQEMFARPYAMFTEMVELNGKLQPRFAKVSS